MEPSSALTHLKFVTRNVLFRPDMSREEAEAFVVEALALAMARDASSGGVIRTVTLDESGATER